MISNTGTVALGADISDFSNAKLTGNSVKKDLNGDIKAGTDYFEIDGQTLEIDWKNDVDAKKIFEKFDKDLGSTTADGWKGLAEDLTNLLNQKMKEQGLSGEVKVTVNDGVFSLESLNESSSGTIGWTGCTNGDGNAADESLGSTLFSKTKGTGEIAEAKKTISTAFAATDKFTMTINGTEVEVTMGAVSKGAELKDLATAVETALKAAIGTYNSTVGHTAATDPNFFDPSKLTVTADKSGGLKIEYTGDNAENFKFSFGEYADPVTGKPGKVAALLGLADASSIKGGARGLTLQIGDTAEQFNKMVVSVNDMHTRALGIDGIDISTQDGAAAAMSKIKDAINQVSDTRGGLGALQNRLDHTINNLGVMRENIQNAESLIRDTDVAEEMMSYTKNSILNQSAQAMLAQANQLPQGVLQLLG